MDAPKTVLIAAGGTGGHVFPGLALARELQQRNYSIHWLGTEAGIESRLIAATDIPLHLVGVQGIRGRGMKALLSAPLNIIRSVLQARKIVKAVRPGLIVGLGGFVAGPGCAAARLSGIPVVIHEQNAVAGTTNKILAQMAAKVLTAFPNVLPEGECIGNPVRADFFTETEKKRSFSEPGMKVLIVGGSRGARAINKLIPETLALLEELTGKVAVLHQTGDALLEESQQYYADVGVSTVGVEVKQPAAGEVRLVSFIEDMAAAFQWADLVICRAGALTVAELAACGVASILIPFPHAIDDHQTSNARYLVTAGAALMWQQSELKASVLARQLVTFLQEPEKLTDMAVQAKKCAMPNAAKEFANWCEKFYQQNTLAGSLG